MTTLALALVVSAAVCHASWNLLVKRAGGGGIPFLWLVLALSLVVYAPVAAVVVALTRPTIGWPEVGFMVGSGALHLSYFLLLQRGYRVGDLSLVYPLARGTGPALSTAAAIAFFGERPSAVALVGVLLVVAGLVSLSRPRRLLRGQAGTAAAAVTYALLTGGFIAGYTLWDKHAVDALSIPPVLLDWASNAVRVLALSPFALGRLREARSVWAAHRTEVVGVAVLSPLAYILVLSALAFTPVSYVAPARELSIVIGAALGTWLLREGEAPRRLAAALVIVAGVIALAVG